ncbi:MAG: hypothetical protein LBJ35_00845 [Spirochaetaceae bacterium]|jgi:hypothetical protein|nr:hypothetical protein [Spirochaetaceae bacterium]
MKKRFASKIFGLLAIYFVIFIVLSFIQFAPHGNFSRQIGDLRVSGSFGKEPADTQAGQTDKEYLIKDGARVSFGGLEFQLSGRTAGGLTYTGTDGTTRAAYPESMTLSEDQARFRLSDGQELLFYAGSEANTNELVISASITGGVKEILLPFKPLGKAKIKNNSFGGFNIDYENKLYTFEMGNINEASGVILLSSTDSAASYRAIPTEDALNLSDFIVLGSMETAFYNEYLERWRGAAYTNWERRISAGNFDENIAVAYLAESARRGALNRSLAALPSAFRRNSGSRTFLSVPFLGSLSAFLNNFSAFERESVNRITSYTKTDSTAYLTEPDVFNYLINIGNNEFFDKGIEYIKTLNPAVITLDMCAGIFEGWLTWKKWRGETENPFDALIPNARSVVSARLKKDRHDTHIFVMDELADARYNLRIGNALAAYGEAADNNVWTAIGRSLIMSALSFSGEDSSISSDFDISAEGEFTPAASANFLTSALIYNELKLSDFYPHTAGLSAISGGVFLWTAASAVNAAFVNDVLDIAVTFPAGESHYIYIVNIRPFSKIQLRGIDWRSDSQFEQYNAPGWLYSSSTNILMVKMVQQSEAEHIRIFF